MRLTAIVTGGSRGIGLEIVKQLGVDGYNVVIIARGEEERYKETYALLKDLEIKYLHLQGNISKLESHEGLVEKTVKHFGGVHILVNNAGVGPLKRSDLLDLSEKSYNHVMDINAKGPLFFTQTVAKQMLKQPIMGNKRGTIINISSISAEVSSVSRGEYCISKAAVSMMTKLFADRLAKNKIIVNEIRPGVIMTDMTSEVQEKYDNMIDNGVFPIARWGNPEDVARVVRFFCQNEFFYTTGDHLYVDGGFHIKRL